MKVWETEILLLTLKSSYLANPANFVSPPMIFPEFFCLYLTEPEIFPTNIKPWESVRAFWSYSVRKENTIYCYIIEDNRTLTFHFIIPQCIFVIWCYLPTEFNGSLIIYNRIIRPYYQKHHNRIDGMANSASRLVADAVRKDN
uniref:SFRICE_028572 n=1 Tax=Spodoptera frugiperda TaxID=7108 RepID=A0A2H1VKT9_SPOFR